MTKEDVYKTIGAVPDEAKEMQLYIYFKESTIKKLRIKTELTKAGFKVFTISDEWMPYEMAISVSNIFYNEKEWKNSLK